MIGESIGHYRVTAKLGEGGMGVVYRATDSRLGRDVAIKVLPPALANDPERLARFEREARTLASLNHASIAAIYGVENGALVMELVEGPALSDRLQAGPLPETEAIEAARQICDALEAAHEKGIVHRDLKPANVKFTASGAVKLLDFGLAKAMERETSAAPAAADSELSPTLTQHFSMAGAILGTAGYMAPEQARGTRVDHRADIWAFGVVLYEMLTAKPLFRGATVSDTLASVLAVDADVSAAPARYRPLLSLCLERDPRRRAGWIGDVRRQLDAPPPAATHVAVAGNRRTVVALAGASLVLALALAAAVLWRPKPAPLPPRHFSFAPYQLNRNPIYRGLAISPDGTRIAYRAEGRLWIRRLDREQPDPVEGGDDGHDPFWSPDSAHIGFMRAARIMRAPVAGGAPVPVCDSGNFIGGAWSGDGKTIAFISGGNLFRVPASGGQPVKVAAGGSQLFSPSFLPVGDGSTWLLANRALIVNPRIVLVNVSTGELREVATGIAPVYAPQGYLIYRMDQGEGQNLLAAPFSLSELKVTGEAMVLASVAGRPSVAADGTLVYMDEPSTLMRLVVRDRQGRSLGQPYQPQTGMTSVSASPEGRRAAVAALEQGFFDIWVQDLERGVRSRLTFDKGNENWPRWSRDGRRIAYTVSAGGEYNVAVQLADGSEGPRILPAHPDGRVVSDWFPDNENLLFQTVGGGLDLWRGRLLPSGALEEKPLLRTPYTETSGKVSPDGKYYAYISDQSGRWELYVRPLDGGSGLWQVSTAGAIQPRFSRDGKELYYLQGGRLMAVPISTANGFSSGVPAELFNTGDILADRIYNKYDTLPGGRFLLIEAAEDNPRAPSIHVVQNWLAAAR